MNHLDYYDFLNDLPDMLAADPTLAERKLSEIQEGFNNRNLAISGFAGSTESYTVYQSAAETFFGSLAQKDVVPVTYSFPEAAESEGLVVDQKVQFNLIYAPWENLGYDGFEGSMEAVSEVLNDIYLLPELRDSRGAYGAYCYATELGVYAFSYRDPNVAETFEVYNGIPDAIASLELDQETLDGYIMSAYSAYALSDGELSGALSALLNYIDGDSQEEVLDIMSSLKSLKAEDLKNYASIYEAFVENCYKATAGGAAAVQENADLYAQILTPFAAEGEKAEIDDLPEDESFASAIQAMIANELMTPVSETHFGSDDSLTAGEYAVVLAALLGAPGYEPADAIALLTRYQYMNRGLGADDPMTRAQFAANLCLVLEFDAEDNAAADAAEYLDKDSASRDLILLAACELMPLRTDADGNSLLAPDEFMTRADAAYVFAWFLE